MAAGTGSPCGACKFLRRKCAPDCVFAPYFWSEAGPARFAAIHKVFGASNVSKLLLLVPVPNRCEAVLTIAYEAQARIRDPVYGCVAHIFALQHQVAYLQAQLMQAKAQLAQTLMAADQSPGNAENQWPAASVTPASMGSSSPFQIPNYYFYNNNNNNYRNQSNISSQSSPDSTNSKKRTSQADLGELQALALTMMKNEN